MKPFSPFLLIWIVFSFAAALPSSAQSVFQFSQDAYGVAEDESFALLMVQRTGLLGSEATVEYGTVNVSALAGSDYVETSGTMTFAAGEKARFLQVPLLNDGVTENIKTFKVALRNPSAGASLGTRATGTVRITDNDKGVQFDTGAVYRVAENAGFIELLVLRGNDAVTPFTVNLATTDGTAKAGLDYTAVTMTVEFAADEKFKLVRIPILNDGLKEADETFSVKLSNPSGATLGMTSGKLITILDNDPGVRIAPAFNWSSSYFAYDTGPVAVVVSRGNDVNLEPFTVDFATFDSSAIAGVDYVASNGTLSFTQGEMSKTIMVDLIADSLVENDEAFYVMLSNPVGATLAGSFAEIVVGDTSSIEPHRFGGIVAAGDQSFHLNLMGAMGNDYPAFYDIYPVDISSDLVTWKHLTSLTQTNRLADTLTLVDASLPEGSRFYRTPTNIFITPYEKPTGPFEVGLVWRQVNDVSRCNRYEVSTNSSYMISIWYPGVPPAGSKPAPVWPEKLSSYIATHATMDAPIAESADKFPVIFFSHGLGGDRGYGSEKGPYFASHGYVVIAVDHIDGDGSILSDGTFVRSLSSSTDVPTQQSRVRDFVFVLDELQRWSTEDPLLAGKLDLANVAISGFSLGAAAAAEFARADPRCKAVALLDAVVYEANSRLDVFGIQKPLLQISASDNYDDRIYERNWTNATYFQISNSVHASMGGDDLAFNRYSGVALTEAREASRTSHAMMLSFFNKNLKGQDDHVLDAKPAGYPRIINWKRK